MLVLFAPSFSALREKKIEIFVLQIFAICDLIRGHNRSIGTNILSIFVSLRSDNSGLCYFTTHDPTMHDSCINYPNQFKL